MPFGLCNASASFQRLVNALFANLKGVHLQVFIDDICVATKTWEEHLNLLDKVLSLLEDANLKLKANKCSFGARKVIFFGHELSSDGIRQDPTKLRAISNLPVPTNADEVRKVLGLFGYYRRFVPNHAQLEEPMRRLTRKDEPFRWDAEQVETFHALETAMLKNTTLAHFDHNSPSLLKTDASKIGIAGILLQQQEGEWRVVTCCSRRVSKTEENYSITELEGLAIIFSVDKLRNYLIGKRFTILTDHCALCVLRKRSPKSAKLRRWQLILNEFDFEIKYVLVRRI